MHHWLQRQHASLGEHEEGNTASLAALQRAAPHLKLREVLPSLLHLPDISPHLPHISRISPQEVLPQMFATMADATLAARVPTRTRTPTPTRRLTLTPPRGF